VVVLLIGAVRLISGQWALSGVTSDLVLLGMFLGVLYIIMVRLAGPMSRGLWTGYVYFMLLVLMLVLGPTASLLLLIFGTAVAVGLIQMGSRATQRDAVPLPPRAQVADFLHEYLARLGVTGGAILIGYATFDMVGAVRPFTDFGDLNNFLRVLIVMQVVYAALVVLGWFVTRRRRRDVIRHVRKTWMIDVTFQFAALLVPFSFYTAGMTPTLIVLILLLFQAVRFHQVTVARNQLQQRSRDVSTLSTLGQAISANLSLDEVLAQVHTRLHELVEPTVVTTVLYDEVNDLLEYPAVLTPVSAQRAQKRKLAHGLIDWVIRNREPLQINMTDSTDVSELGIELAAVDVQAFIGVPLMVGETLIGALAVGHETDAKAFDRLDITVLQTIAAQAALAIRNANLYSRTLRLSTNMSIINESMQQVMFNLDRESLVQTACHIACQVTGAQKAALFVVRERLGMVLAGHVGLEALANDSLTPFPYRPDLYLPGSHIETNIDETSDPDLYALAQRGGFRSMLEVPLRSSNTLVGVLAVYQDEPHYFDYADINLLEMLASQVTAAFDNTDLLQALEMYASEQAQLVYLSRVSSSNLDLERVVVDLAMMLSQMIGLPQVAVGLLRDDDALDVYTPQPNNEGVRVEVLPLSALPEIELATENPHISNPYVMYHDDESLSPAAREYLRQHGMTVLMLMPMMVSRQVFGVLMLSARDPMTITDTMRRLMEMAIHQVSAQVHNARLYTITEEALSQQLEQLSLIEDLSHKISQSLNVPTIAGNVLDAVLRATRVESAEMLLKESAQQWRVFRQQLGQNMTVTLAAQAELTPDLVPLIERRDLPREEILTNQQGIVVCMPLLSGERMLGLLRVQGGEHSRLGVEELNFLRSLSGHTAVSIDNAFLLEEQQFQVKALTRLRDLSLQVASSQDDQNITAAILQTTLDVLDGTEAALYAYDTRTDEIVPMVGLRRMATGYSPVEPRLATHPIYDAIATRQLVTHQLAANIETDPQGNMIYPTLIAVPIIRRGEVAEVLVVGFDQQRDLDRRDLNFAELLVVQVANHLETVLLNRTIHTANKRMRAILDSTRDGIILLDNFGRVLDANLQASRLLGVNLNDAIGDSFTRFLRKHYSSTPLEAHMLALGTEPVGEHREVELPRSEGPIYLQTSTLPVRDANGANLGRLLSLRDISEDKQLAMMRESLQRMVIHDLRSPMGAIMTGLSFLQVLVDELDPEVARDMRRTLDASLESADNLMRLMDTLRDIPRMKDIQLELQPIAIATLVNKAYESLETLFVEARIEFEVMNDVNIRIAVDIDLMRRVLVNLLHNALKFTPEGGKIMVITDVNQEEALLRVRVCDTGPGIPPAMRERIFGEFQQVEGQVPKRGGRGTGLGLTLCKLAVEAHGGRIWVDGDGPLPGACFTFTLPLSPAGSARQAAV
jgi:PAS domain S-box-containing protein